MWNFFVNLSQKVLMYLTSDPFPRHICSYLNTFCRFTILKAPFTYVRTFSNCWRYTVMKKMNPEGWLGPQKESMQQTTLVWSQGKCLEAGRRWTKSCCFDSADFAYVSARKCLKSTENAWMHSKQYLINAKLPSHLPQLDLRFSMPDVA